MTAITPPTPDNVADMLTSGDNDYHDGNDWWRSIGSAGNVVELEITPVGADYETKLAPVHFEAHVFAVEPAPPVASVPVELPVELAKELTYGGPDGPPLDGWKCVAIIEGEVRRVERWHDMVIRDESSGAYYLGTYLEGMGDVEYPTPWDEDVPVFEPVVPRVQVVRSVEWVKPTAAADASGGVS